jgi:hypothetical protein
VAEKTVLQQGLDRLAAAVTNNFKTIVESHGAAATPRTFAFALVVTTARWARFNISREHAINWFIRAYDEDGFSFGSGEKVD